MEDPFERARATSRRMTDREIRDAERTLIRERGEKTLTYRGWRVTRGPLGSFAFLTQVPNGLHVGTDYGGLAECVDSIEAVMAEIN